MSSEGVNSQGETEKVKLWYRSLLCIFAYLYSVVEGNLEPMLGSSKTFLAA